MMSTRLTFSAALSVLMLGAYALFAAPMLNQPGAGTSATHLAAAKISPHGG